MVVAACAVALAGVLLSVASRPVAKYSPQATLTLLSYERITKTNYISYLPKDDWANADTPAIRLGTSPSGWAERVQTNTEVLMAHVRLRNTGNHPIAFESTSDIPKYWCRVRRAETWSDCSGYHFSGGPFVMEPGKEVGFWVSLPPDVSAWQFGFLSHSAGPRLRIAWKCYDLGLRGRIADLFLYAVPRGSDVYAELQTDPFEVPSSGTAAHTRELRVVR